MIGKQEAYIYAMVLTSAADQDMSDIELRAIGNLVQTMPAFDGFDDDLLPEVATNCADLLGEDDGLDAVITTIKQALTPNQCETAYAFAVEIAASDLEARPEELRVLELLRGYLEIDRLVAAAIERTIRIRYFAG